MKTLCVVLAVVVVAVQGTTIRVPRVWTACSADCDGGTRDEVLSGDDWQVNCNTFSCDLQINCVCSKSDLMLVMDDSGSIGEKDFWAQKQFGIDIVRGLKRVGGAAASGTRVAMVKFNREVDTVFDFDEGMTLDDVDALETKIWDTLYDAGSTNTAAGLKRATEIFNTQGTTDRKRIAIVLTDGASNVQKDQTIPAADALRAAGVAVYCIGIGNVTDAEVRAIANQPSTTDASKVFYYYVTDYSALNTIVDTVLSGTCCNFKAPECVTDVAAACSQSCGGGRRSATQTCTHFDVYGDVFTTMKHVVRERCCTAPCPPTADECRVCYNNHKYALRDKVHRDKYYPCGNGIVYTRQSCATGLVWDANSYTCNWAAQSKEQTCSDCVWSNPGKYEVCEGQATAPPPTTTTARAGCPFEPVPGKPAQFYRWKGHSAALQCGRGMIMDFTDTVCTCIAMAPAPKRCVSDLLLYLSFDDGVQDSSCSGAYVENNGVEVRSDEGLLGGGAAFFSGSCRLSVPLFKNWFADKFLSTWSVSVWVRRTGRTGGAVNGIINNGDCKSAPGFSVGLDNSMHVVGGLRMKRGKRVKAFNMDKSYTVKYDAWQHIAMVYDGRFIREYINGKNVHSFKAKGYMTNNQDCGIKVGQQFSAIDTHFGYFIGYMDELRVASRVLTEREISLHYDKYCGCNEEVDEVSSGVEEIISSQKSSKKSSTKSEKSSKKSSKKSEKSSSKGSKGSKGSKVSKGAKGSKGSKGSKKA